MAELIRDKKTVRLKMRGISKHFGATVALEQVNFDVHVGEVHVLIGENGAGKSTLMKVLSGAHRPDAGKMFLDGEPYQPQGPLDARRKGVGMIYQELSLAPHLTVEENIMLGVEPTWFGFIKRRDVRAKAQTALNFFDHPEIKPDSKVRDLSAGAQQLVEIGRALAIGCRVLVFDEPTSSLSQKDIHILFEIIHGLKQQGLSIIYISHFLEEVEQIADRLTVLRDGTVVGTRKVGDVATSEIVTMMVGREVSVLYPRSSRKAGEAIMEISHLAGVKKPKDASLTLHRGEVLGICGLVGAGRSEFLRAIFGLDPIRKGNVRVGIYTGPASPVKRWTQGMGMLSENRKDEGLALNLTVADNVTLSKLSEFGALGFIFPKKQNAVTQNWIQQMDIRCRGADQKVAALSGGNQQKVALARLLQHDVDVLLLDEPTRGIDVAAKAKIYEVIDRLVSEKNNKPKAVLMVSSYLPELLGLCDRIAVMARGKLSAIKNVDLIDEHQLMLAATGQVELL